jgi:outer membrane protein OmpA-like peptidoglycan-associated protein
VAEPFEPIKAGGPSLLYGIKRLLERTERFQVVLIPILTAVLTAGLTWLVTQSQERTKTYEPAKLAALTQSLGGQTGQPEELATKSAQARKQTLLLTDTAVARQMAEVGRLGCYKWNWSVDQAREQIQKCEPAHVDLLNSFRREIGLSPLPPDVVRDALAFKDLLAVMEGPPKPKAQDLPPPPPPPMVSRGPQSPTPVYPPSELAWTYRLFFGESRSSEVEDGARATIKQAVVPYEAGRTRILVMGHTDTDEVDDINLSSERALKVKNALIEQGIPAEIISTIGFGASSPQVQTPEKVREPQNRRVDITVLRAAGPQ